jgi:hypothetical protein
MLLLWPLDSSHCPRAERLKRADNLSFPLRPGPSLQTPAEPSKNRANVLGELTAFPERVGEQSPIARRELI